MLFSAHFIPKINIIEQQRLLVENNKLISPEEFINKKNAYPFSQTADGYAQGTGLNRTVRDISLLNAPRYLRSGYVNTYNFYGPPPNLMRERLPFVVVYKINECLVERGLSGRGIFYFKNQFFTQSAVKPIVFSKEDIGSDFYAFAVDTN